MGYGIALVFQGVGEADYWAVNDQLGIAAGGTDNYPSGLITHAAGPTPDGWMVIEVWDSKSSQEKFMAERLGAALAAAGVPAPSGVMEIDTVNLQQLG